MPKKTSSTSKVLEKAKKKHFEHLRKNNAVTDAKNGDLSLAAMKTLDILLHIWQETGETQLTIEISSLRARLGLQNNNDYVERIKLYLLELKLPFELRDFKDRRTGRMKSFSLTSFLSGDINSFKTSQHIIELEISSSFIDFMIDRAGFTEIDLVVSGELKTKYAYKIYEMYLRYYGRPTHYGADVGHINIDMDDLNEKFGTNHKHPSQMLRGIGRGMSEIEKELGILISCFYHKPQKQFVFSWDKSSPKKTSLCIIPYSRVPELTDWIIAHTKYKIDNLYAYKSKISGLLREGKYAEAESMYRGMLQHKYGFTKEAIDQMQNLSDGKYQNFSKNPISGIQNTLF